MKTTELIDITGIGSELQGVGRLADGRAVFVPETIPGERVAATVTQDKGRFCLSGSSVQAIFQARIPEQIAISYSRGSSQPRDQTCVSYVSCIGRCVLYH